MWHYHLSLTTPLMTKTKKFKPLLSELSLIIIYLILSVSKAIYFIVYLKCHMDLIVSAEID